MIKIDNLDINEHVYSWYTDYDIYCAQYDWITVRFYCPTLFYYLFVIDCEHDDCSIAGTDYIIMYDYK